MRPVVGKGRCWQGEADEQRGNDECGLPVFHSNAPMSDLIPYVIILAPVPALSMPSISHAIFAEFLQPVPFMSETLHQCNRSVLLRGDGHIPTMATMIPCPRGVGESYKKGKKC